MTKREHDLETKQNYGGPMGHRSTYRLARGRVPAVDKIAARAAEMAWRNCPYGVLVDGYYLPTLGRGSRHRTIAAWRASQGRRLLG